MGDSDDDMNDVRDIPLDEKHQALLQTFIDRRIIEQSTLAKIVSSIKNYYRETNGTPNDYINKINSSIISVSLKISNLRTANKQYWCLVNLKIDEGSKLATKYAPVETTYFKVIVEAMLANGGEARTSALVDLSKGIKDMTMTKAERIIRIFKEDGWLKETSNTTISLSDRSIMDLGPLLVDLPECCLCHQRVLVQNNHIDDCERCNAKMHPHCLETWKKKNNNCPSCSQPL
ncbi:hypothetical protein DFA_07304 [Cavenderia fasciculata]|uniref:Non-structural maintenance of chromosomes element 1 homolog n=1 Tax=Cavenderia fasciculata TaxID=261658 RepID=F4PW20_CACFS|nr:uncharacterized protein DFA_07304 [Cavenderia fasciculata]EGG20184.1 hypothetical protein DFA_07304 [Cavenderia fasciculata]|eukprot:XP_004367167.1 hypothetical protein DFA_07304 [Cavenderia fasciculata]